jgi:hypothetical protein
MKMKLPHQNTIAASNKNSWMTWADWTGLVASIACGIHCAAMPLLLSYLPSFGLNWLAHEGFHQWMTMLCFIFAASAFIPGWRKHKSLVPALSGLIGITLLSLSAFVFGDECCAAAITDSPVAQSPACTDTECSACCEQEDSLATAGEKTIQFATFTNWLSPLGGLFLVIGHIANHRKNCTCSGGHCCLDGDQALQQINDLKDVDG